ncbi:hypothetical protein [Clostridium ljungdahlii]|uniref:Uncharacterized protein n=1 Tax=Clostridium ljungdahlii TaxID=1538 RepID=A0A168LQU9_9CLOT|nr:hypothetical protein [Clostridium ljungdahlii]OAA83573.1 hypothetical protein WY13_03360 [Clostridium ljungdahlii]
MKNGLNFVKPLIQIVYDRGEINELTYKKIMHKLKKEEAKNERSN